MALSLALLGRIALAEKQAATAMAHYDEALTLSRSLADRLLMATALEGLASIAAAYGQAEYAQRLATSADALRERPSAAADQSCSDGEEAVVEALRRMPGVSPGVGMHAGHSASVADQGEARGRHLQVARLQDE
jgi:hypothetical protein